MAQLAYPRLLPTGRIRILIRAEGPGGIVGDAMVDLRRGEGWGEHTYEDLVAAVRAGGGIRLQGVNPAD